MLNKARNLFWRKGFEGTSIRDIAKAYGCNTSNIYNFFSSKEALLYEALLDEYEQLVEPIKHLETDDSLSPVEQLRFIIKHLTALSLSQKRTSKFYFDLGLESLSPNKRKHLIEYRDKYEYILRRVIHRGIELGQFERIDTKLASFMVTGMIVRTRIWYKPKKNGLSVPELSDFIFHFALKALKVSQPT